MEYTARDIQSDSSLLEANRGRACRSSVESNRDERMPRGPAKVFLVGAGPGDPGLLTRRGEAVLSRADVVIYDHLACSRLLDLAPPGALKVRAGKSIGHCTLTQEEINHLLVEHARGGRTVVRLKGGDPLVFGRGAEEAIWLRAAGVPFEIVPGVTAGVGVTAYAGIPVTHRAIASAVAFVTGHGDPEADPTRSPLDWAALARFPGTLVVYMGVTHLPAICRTLLRLGKPGETPAAIVESGTLPAQETEVATLATLARTAIEAGVRPPALLVVGPVVSLRSDLAWYEALPLFGQRILITRPREEAGRAAAALEALGAEVVVAPTVEVRPITENQPLDAAIERLADYDWLVFTSASGVRFFVQRLEERGRDLRVLGHLKLAAIGPATARALAQHHLRPDLVPDAYRSESLAAALTRHAPGKRILLARADRGRTILREELERSADVEQVAVYQNADAEFLPDEVVERICGGTLDWITLTSSAIATRLHALLPEEARQKVGRQVRLASISPVTSDAAAAVGWSVAAEATEFTWEGLVQALVDRVAADRAGAPSQSSAAPRG
jgi:uroporphyrinogen III methyltransferase/synthase